MTNNQSSKEFKQVEIAGLRVAVWQPQWSKANLPLIIFSHGFDGVNSQSKFIMSAIAEAGYLVMAPDHADSWHNHYVLARPKEKIGDQTNWDDKKFADRGSDIRNLLLALHESSDWNSRIDWSKVALAGHSLGGYTVLALSGALPSWRLPNIKAVVVFSPVCEPLILRGNLGQMGIPVMYQGGSKDLGITPSIARTNGAYDKTFSPAYFVDFDRFDHFSWTDFNRDVNEQNLINYYTLAFLDKYVKGNAQAKPDTKLPGVISLRVK